MEQIKFGSIVELDMCRGANTPYKEWLKNRGILPGEKYKVKHLMQTSIALEGVKGYFNVKWFKITTPEPAKPQVEEVIFNEDDVVELNTDYIPNKRDADYLASHDIVPGKKLAIIAVDGVILRFANKSISFIKDRFKLSDKPVFKIGDQVRCIGDTETFSSNYKWLKEDGIKIGDILTIHHVSEDDGRLFFEDKIYYQETVNFELVVTSETVKPAFKVGDKVRCVSNKRVHATDDWLKPANINIGDILTIEKVVSDNWLRFEGKPFNQEAINFELITPKPVKPVFKVGDTVRCISTEKPVNASKNWLEDDKIKVGDLLTIKTVESDGWLRFEGKDYYQAPVSFELVPEAEPVEPKSVVDDKVFTVGDLVELDPKWSNRDDYWLNKGGITSTSKLAITGVKDGLVTVAGSKQEYFKYRFRLVKPVVEETTKFIFVSRDLFFKIMAKQGLRLLNSELRETECLVSEELYQKYKNL